MSYEIRTAAAEARASSTSPERLRELAKSPYLSVRRNCAHNPNTPIDALYGLVAEFPRNFLKNPTVQLLLMDINSFVDNLTEEGRAALAGLAIAPVFLLEKLAMDESYSVHSALAGNSSSTEKVLKEIIRRNWSNSAIYRKVALHENLPKDNFEEAVKNAKRLMREELDVAESYHNREKAREVMDEMTDFYRIITDHEYSTKEMRREQPFYPDHEDTWEEWEKEENEDAWEDWGDEEGCALNEYPEEDRDQLNSSGDIEEWTLPRLTEWIVEHTSLDQACHDRLIDALLRLSEIFYNTSIYEDEIDNKFEEGIDNDSEIVSREVVLSWLAWHPQCPNQISREADNTSILGDITRFITTLLSDNDCFSDSFLAEIACNSCVGVRRIAAGLCNLPGDVLIKLAKDEDDLVSLKAVESIFENHLDESFFSNDLADVILRLARSQDSSISLEAVKIDSCESFSLELSDKIDILWRLAQDESPRIRSGVVELAQEEEDLLDLLLDLTNDESFEVLIQYVSIKEDSLTNCRDILINIFEYAIGSQDQFAILIRAVASRYTNLSESLINIFSRDLEVTIRKNIACHPNCSKEAMQSLARDREWSVRQAVASHKNCPLDLLMLLASDKNYKVRAAADKALSSCR